MLGRHPEPGSDQHRAEFVAVEAGGMRLVVQAWAAARAADVGVVIGHLPGWAEAREAGPARARATMISVSTAIRSAKLTIAASSSIRSLSSRAMAALGVLCGLC
jgi:hypothetical protein